MGHNDTWLRYTSIGNHRHNPYKYDKKDIIATITEYTAYCIKYAYDNYIKDIDKIIIGGGGAHNKFIMKSLREHYGENVVFTQNEIGYSSDAKEAIAFVVLGFLSLNSMSGNVKSATGAKKDAVLGNITL